MAKKGHRQHIILESSESGHQYHTTKNKKLHPDRMEVKKYCPRLRKYTIHKEKK